MMEKIICYAIIFVAEAVTAWSYFEYLFTAKTKTLVQVVTFLIGYTILFGIFFADNLLLNALMTCVINAALARINYRCAIKTAILHGAFLEFAIVGTELLINLLIVWSGYDFSAYTYDLRVLIAMAVISKLLYLVVSLLAARIFKPHKHSNEEPRLMVLFCSLPLFSIAMAVLIIYLGLSSEMTRSAGIMMGLTTISLLIVNLLFLILYNHLQKANAEYVALRLSMQKEQADVVYYRAMQEQFENQRILIHDIKNHLQSINGLAKDGKVNEIESYISKLETSLLPSTKAKLCNEPILNMMLLRYADECKAHNIDFQCDIRENTSSFMDAPSITTLYGNLLSNAFEAALSTEERQVEISVKQNADQAITVIKVINSCDNVATMDSDGYYRSTKKDGMYHGIGLKSIKRIVKKYNGVSTTYYDRATRKFHHIIQFPTAQQ